MPAQRLKHIYSAITLTSNDLATIAWWWARLAEPDLRANAYHLQSIAELADVLREDQVIDRLSIVATGGARRLSFAYDPGYVLIEASDADAPLLVAFTAAADLLATKAKNGYAQCLVELSPPGTWRAPRLPTSPAATRAAAQERAAPAAAGGGGGGEGGPPPPPPVAHLAALLRRPRPA